MKRLLHVPIPKGTPGTYDDKLTVKQLVAVLEGARESQRYLDGRGVEQHHPVKVTLTSDGLSVWVS